jgi:hypothetical protein
VKLDAEDLVDRLEALEDRVDDLQAEKERLQEDLAAERKRSAELEERVAELEEQPTLRMKGGEDIKHIWVEDIPLGLTVRKNKSRAQDLDERVWDLERGEADLSELMAAPSAEMLPIQRKTAERKAGNHDLKGNGLRATYIWSELAEHSRREAGKVKLDSVQVRNILSKHRLRKDNNTVRRTMRFVAKWTSSKPKEERDAQDGDNLFCFIPGSENNTGSKSVLVANADAWDEWVAELEDADRPTSSDHADVGTDDVEQEAAEEMAQLTQNAQPIADGGKDVDDESSDRGDSVTLS